MKSIAAGRFKDVCLKVLDEVAGTRDGRAHVQTPW
jgi:hypothetical protein